MHARRGYRALGLWADPQDRTDEFTEVIQQRRLSNREYRFRLRNGQEITGLLFAEVIEYDDELCALTVITDKTEFKEAQDVIRESEERVRLATRAAEMGVWDKNLRTGRLRWDSRCMELLGLPPDASPSARLWLSVLHPEDRKLVRTALKQVMASQGDGRLTVEYRLRPCVGNTEKWLLASGQAYFDKRGRAVRCSGVLLDITERKQLEAEREKLLEQERAAHEAALAALQEKDDFVALVSHELRGPLNAILGWARILKRGGYDEGVLPHAIEVIERSACTQQQLIEDLLDTARLGSGQLRLEMHPVILGKVIEAAADVVRPAASAKELDLQLQLLSSDAVTGDSHRLQQVFWNLLANAVKFTPRGGRVTVRLERIDPFMQISVSDTGRGLESDLLPHVFDRYWQAENGGARGRGGLGLGLALVQQLVELHGGVVAAESAGVGRGANFIVNLPLRAIRPKASDMLGTAEVPKETSYKHLNYQNEGTRSAHLSPVLKGVRVLVVDDEADARELLVTLLKQCGAQVIAADSAAAALDALDDAAAHASLPDILISDIGMPEEDGYQLMQQVRARPAISGGQLAAIALTAFGSSTDRVRALTAGFQTHLVKPVEPAELSLVISSLTRRARKKGVLLSRGQAPAELKD